MQLTALKYGYAKVVNTSFDEALENVRNALQSEGFGVQAEINISNALKEKLGVEVPRQMILGACNPQLAFEALQLEPEVSLLLPCNVTIQQKPGAVEVAVIDAAKLMSFVGNPALEPLAAEAGRRLQRVLEKIQP
ncbi:MAG TPA: DUF302 domain-containing protein [Candidatus Limnocylindrales bacterium]|nr:DUF302 domain-containing protein [Candidatus Limnocylindrales bacterium]